MHSDETIDVCAPFWAFPGAHGHLDGAAETHGDDFRKLDAAAVGQTGTNDNNVDKNNKKEEDEGDDGLYQHRFDGMMDVDVGSGGPAVEVEEHIADNVDGFLDDFLALAGGGDGGVAEEDLNWLEVRPKEQLRRQKVARYLEKKKRRRSTKACSYQSRQRVANARPRHKGRFLPLESEFVPIAELQRRQRALVKEMRDKAAALAAAAVSGDAVMTSPDFGQHVAV